MSLFVTFEGGEGSGKSSQISALIKLLEAKNIPYVFSREPGGTRIGDAIRDVLLNPEHTEMNPLSELLLYLASRKQNIMQLIIPALKQGKIVLCDRYEDSSVVYQGYARGLGMERVVQLSRDSGIDLIPDITFLFDIDASEGLVRTRGRSRESITRFENELLAFHDKVRQGYLLLAQKECDRFEILDSSRPFDEVHERLCKILMEKIGSR